MKTMKALVARTAGEPTEVLRLETRPTRVPARCAGGCTPRRCIRQICTSRAAANGFSPQFLAVLGMESVGTVDALGDGIESPGIGQRVITVGITGTWQQTSWRTPDAFSPCRTR
jgi:NADPH:quinone reductase-like Zn-dependent oxidoreductase